MKTRFQTTKLLMVSRKQKKEIKKQILTKMGCRVKDLKSTSINEKFAIFSEKNELQQPLMVFNELLLDQEITTNYLFGSIEIKTKTIFFLVDIDETLSIGGEDTIMPNTGTKKIYVKLI